MARVFKLARYSTSLQTFGHTLQSSITELSMLSMFLITGIVFFSTIMYYLEKDEPHTDFYSIPAGCWWCVVTMATVGYGDAKPVTTLGKLVATSTSICGIIVLAFPISMIVEKFATAQQKAIEDQQIQQAQMSALANNALLRRFPTRRKVRRNTNTTVSVSNI
uniref:Ion_trans domain-containing protein n=1 Tax=Caenorhabditis japonica TaxID=281687 RepID=A0A8R1ERX3_CAEJA